MLLLAACVNTAEPVRAQGIDQIGRWLGPYPVGYNNQGIHTAVVRGPEDSTTILMFGRGHNVLWRMRADTTFAVPTTSTLRAVPVGGSEPATVLFCSGHASTGDGRLAVFGGTHHGAAGTAYIYSFDPLQAGQSAEWVKEADMSQERWYPSVAELADGSIFIMAGQRYPLMQTFGGQTGNDTSDVSDEFSPYTLGRPGVWSVPALSGTPPSGRTDHAACFDRGAVGGVRRLLIHGGSNADGEALDDLLTLERRALNLSLGAALDDTAYAWSAATVDISSEGKPSARRHHTMTLTEWREAYLVGGQGSDGTASTDFIWRLERVLTADSSRWNWKWNKLEVGTEIATGDAPMPRWGHTVVFDADESRKLAEKPKLILFGGTDGDSIFTDTWFLRLDPPLRWEKLTATEAPGGRAHHTAMMDVREANSPTEHSHEEGHEITACSLGEVHRMIVYGGDGGSGPTSDLYVLNRTKEGTEAWCWESVNPPSGPIPPTRENHTAIFDAGWNRMIVYGGAATGDSLLSDVWTLIIFSTNPYRWEESPVAESPTPLDPRKGHTAAFDGRYNYAIFPERYYSTTTGAAPDVVRTMEDAPQVARGYPFVFALPRDGAHVFYGGPLGAGVWNRALIDPHLGGDPASATWEPDSLENFQERGSAVQHRPGRIMRAGQTAGGDSRAGSAEADTLRYDGGDVLVDPVLGWQALDNMSRPRANHNLVATPLGSVMVFGGLSAPQDSASAVRKPQIWVPGTGTWGDSLAEDPAVRNYHSTAILLPDARVLSAGGDNTPNPNWNRITIFEPPYLFDGSNYVARPVIERAPRRIRYGQQFSLCTPQYATVDSICLIRPGAVTHAFNMDQRYVQLAFARTYGGAIATAPADSFIASPGDYLVFLIDSLGTLRPPSVGRWVRIGEHVLDGATPDTLTDFQADLVSTSQIQTTWTSPDLTGELSDGYMIRYSPNPIVTEGDFLSATPITYTLGCECPGTVQTAAVANLQACTWYYFAAKVRSSSNEYSGMARFKVKTLCGGGGGLSAVETSDAEGGHSAASIPNERDRLAQTASAGPGTSSGWTLTLEGDDTQCTLAVTRVSASSPDLSSGIEVLYATSDGWKLTSGETGFEGQDVAVLGARRGWRLRVPGQYTMGGLGNPVTDDAGTVWVTTSARHSASGHIEPASIDAGALENGDTLYVEYEPGEAEEPQPWFCVLDTEQAGPAQRREGPESDPGSSAPLAFALHAATPNPSSGPTRIRFDLPQGTDVRLELFDVHGRRVLELARGHFGAGRHSLDWSGRDSKGQRVSPGVYTCRLIAGEHSGQVRLVVVP